MSLKLKNMTGDNVLFKAVARDIPLSGGGQYDRHKMNC